MALWLSIGNEGRILGSRCRQGTHKACAVRSQGLYSHAFLLATWLFNRVIRAWWRCPGQQCTHLFHLTCLWLICSWLWCLYVGCFYRASFICRLQFRRIFSLLSSPWVAYLIVWERTEGDHRLASTSTRYSKSRCLRRLLWLLRCFCTLIHSRDAGLQIHQTARRSGPSFWTCWPFLWRLWLWKICALRDRRFQTNLFLVFWWPYTSRFCERLSGCLAAWEFLRAISLAFPCCQRRQIFTETLMRSGADSVFRFL